MTWTVTVHDDGTVALDDPVDSRVTATTATGDVTLRTDTDGVPADPDLRTTAADHVAAEYRAGNISLPTGIKWAMDAWEIVDAEEGNE